MKLPQSFLSSFTKDSCFSVRSGRFYFTVWLQHIFHPTDSLTIGPWPCSHQPLYMCLHLNGGEGWDMDCDSLVTTIKWQKWHYVTSENRLEKAMQLVPCLLERSFWSLEPPWKDSDYSKFTMLKSPCGLRGEALWPHEARQMLGQFSATLAPATVRMQLHVRPWTSTLQLCPSSAGGTQKL